MFAIELVLPFFIFTPRRIRYFVFWSFVALQVFIMLTGNYCFFNLLTIALCILLLDDLRVQRLFPAKWRPCLPMAAQGLFPISSAVYSRLRGWPRAVTIPVMALAMAISLMQAAQMFRIEIPWPRPMLAVYQWISPFRTFNNYGLFAVMTTRRPEIIVEGSEDGVAWHEYEFNYKPGDVKGPPRFVEPHQPRLDWQMWFAALGDHRQNPWFVSFCVKLLQGSPEVLALLQRNPFPKAPPRYLRAQLYEYHFTDFPTRRKSGAWWKRESQGLYLPAISLKEQAAASPIPAAATDNQRK
jgi:hypothetical protein